MHDRRDPQATASPSSSPSIEMPEYGAVIRTLENGMEIIVKADESAPVASLQLWVRTGSIHEGDWMGAGLSHFVEHMLFKGTEKRHYSEIAKAIQETGGYVNAYTTFDRTVYWIDAPSSGVAPSLEILADMAMNSTFPEEEYDKEAEVIRREFAMGNDDPGRVFSKLLYRTAFHVHPFGQPVIGHLDVFNQLTRDDLFGYYKRRYVPSNVFLVVVGDVDADEVQEYAETIFGGWKREATPPVHVPTEPPQLGPREASQEFAVPTTRFALSWRIPGISHADAPALDVLSSVLGSGKSSRFYRQLREEEKLAHSIYASAWTPGSDGLFSVGGDCDPKKYEKLLVRVQEMLAEVRERGITEEEFEKARRMFLAESLDALSSMRDQASDIGSSWLHARDVDFTKRYLQAAAELGQGDVREVARRYLVEETRTTTRLLPKGTGEAKSKSKRRKSTGEIQRHELSNGMTLLLKADARLPLTASYAVFRGGLLADEARTAGLGSMHATMLLKGSAARDAATIASDVEDLGGTIGSQSGMMTFGLTAETLRPDLSVALGVMGDVLAAPTMPEKTLVKEKKSRIARIREKLQRPMTLANLRFREALFHGHVWALPPSGHEESVGAITRDDVLERHESLTVGANGIIAVFGDVDAAEVIAETEARFGSLPKGELAHQNVAPIPAPPSPPVIIDENADKEQAVILFGYHGLALLDDDALALDLLDEACSDMASPLFTRIREELGLAYYVGAGQFTGYVPGAIYFYAGTSPEEADRVEEELMKEVAKIADNGLPEEEISRAKATFLGKTQLGLQGNLSLAQTTALNELHGLGFEYHLGIAERIAAIDSEDIRRVASLLKGDPPVRVRVMPEG